MAITDLAGQEFGQYRIVALMGLGGMASVYRARQLNMGRDVAIKVIKPELMEMKDFTARFEREAKTIASLSHLHILKVFDYGQYKDMWYLVMELLDGGTLADLIAQGPVPLNATLRLLEQIASALDYAHRRGIIHRDLKPQNVLLDGDQNAFLADFGLAKILDATSALTHTGMSMGTPAYMAPEQWQGGTVDARSDIYSLGIILYEMLCGTVPFNGDTPFRMMHMHIYEQPRLLGNLKPDIPTAVDLVISKALSKNPSERFAAAGDMVAELRNAVMESPSSNFRRPISQSNLGSGLSEPEIKVITLLPIENQGIVPPPPASPPSQTMPKQQPPASRTVPQASKSNHVPLSMAFGLLALSVLVVGGLIIFARRGSESTLPTVAVIPTSTVAVALIVPTNTASLTLSPTVTATRTPTPTATKTATPTATNTPTATIARSITNLPVASSLLAIAVNSVNAHIGPGESYHVVYQMHPGEQLPLAGIVDIYGFRWFEVQLKDNSFAWVTEGEVHVYPPAAPVPPITLTLGGSPPLRPIGPSPTRRGPPPS